MTKRLEAAIDRLRSLPEGRQDEIAELLMGEINANQLDLKDPWVQSTQRNPAAVQRLAANVTAEFRSGKCQPLDPEKL